MLGAGTQVSAFYRRETRKRSEQARVRSFALAASNFEILRPTQLGRFLDLVVVYWLPLPLPLHPSIHPSIHSSIHPFIHPSLPRPIHLNLTHATAYLRGCIAGLSQRDLHRPTNISLASAQPQHIANPVRLSADLDPVLLSSLG